MSQSIYNFFHKIEEKNIPLEKGDLFVTYLWSPLYKSPIMYQHSGLVSNEPVSNQLLSDQRYEIIDCTSNSGCSVRRIRKSKHHEAEYDLYIARLPHDIPFRDEIIDQAVELTKYLIVKKAIRYPKFYGVIDFLKLLVGKCLGSPSWPELRKYIQLFLIPYVVKGNISNEAYSFFCSRIVLIVYQLSAWYVLAKHKKKNEEIIQIFQDYFPFKPRFCRPWHILTLNKNKIPWLVFKTTGWHRHLKQTVIRST